jgi:hypothetical protein
VTKVAGSQEPAIPQRELYATSSCPCAFDTINIQFGDFYRF